MSADKETLRLRQLFQNIMEINRPDISVRLLTQMKTRKRPIIHSYYQHVADKFWPVFLPIALVGAAWFVWKVRREVKNR